VGLGDAPVGFVLLADLRSPLELLLAPPAAYASARVALPMLIEVLERIFTLKARVAAQIADYDAQRAKAKAEIARDEAAAAIFIRSAQSQASEYRPGTVELTTEETP